MAVVKTEIITVREFLSNSKLNIPVFQRPYKWTTRNVIQLLEDIERFSGQSSYRIGTIVVYRDEDHTCKIVDGQQRTLTLLLIVKAFRSIRYDGLISQELKVAIGQLSDDIFAPTFTSEVSKHNIRENYMEILRRVQQMDEKLLDFLLNNCEVTHLVIDDISEAFQFFDSQNSRGKDLEPHDLLKAFHLRELNSSNDKLDDHDLEALVEAWENMDSDALSSLFADFLYRVRGWSKGDSARVFTKQDTPLFKGINLDKIDEYPYTRIYQMVKRYLDEINQDKDKGFPFQLDQTIINGKYFFQMISYYKQIFEQIATLKEVLSDNAQYIIDTLNNYEGKTRTGDKYVRMLFDCALLYYIDKFGMADISKAIEKIFIWAYSLRLTYQSLQFASIDNYVVKELNVFKLIKEAVFKEDILRMELKLLSEDSPSTKTVDIKSLFIKMNYYYAN